MEYMTKEEVNEGTNYKWSVASSRGHQKIKKSCCRGDLGKNPTQPPGFRDKGHHSRPIADPRPIWLWHTWLLPVKKSGPYGDTEVTSNPEVYRFTVVHWEPRGLELNSFPEVNKWIYIDWRAPWRFFSTHQGKGGGRETGRAREEEKGKPGVSK